MDRASGINTDDQPTILVTQQYYRNDLRIFLWDLPTCLTPGTTASVFVNVQVHMPNILL